LLISLYII